MYTPLKPKKKLFRVLFQLIVLLTAAAWVVYVTIERGRPKPQDKDEWIQRRGFLALAYGGISRTEDGPNLPRSMLRKHLEALAEAGYEAITVEDIVNFYENGGLLPDRPVFIMFEGGRRDSAVYGQESLIRTGMRATMFVYTGLLSSWDRTFLTKSQVSTLGRSRFWDVGLLGERIYLPEADGGDPEARRYYLNDFLRGKDGQAVETREQFRERARRDYEESARTIEKLTGRTARTRIFSPANTLSTLGASGSLDPVVAETNQELLAETSRLAFTREGQAFNSRSTHPRELGRLRVPADCSVETLLALMATSLPVRSPYTYSQDRADERWRREFGGVTFLPDAIRLNAEDGGAALTRLAGREGWKNMRVRMRVELAPGEQALYLRFESKESFIKIVFSGGMMRVLGRIPGHGLEQLMEREVPGKGDVRLTALLRNNRLGIHLDGESAAESLIPVTTDRAGWIALEVAGSEDAAAMFSEFSISPIPSRWRLADSFRPDMETDGTGFLFSPTGDSAQESSGLLQAADHGFERYALLPAGEYSPDVLLGKTEGMRRMLARRLWTGVVFTPQDGDVQWTRMREAARNADDLELKAAFRLNRAQAEQLAGLTAPPAIDRLLLEKDCAGMSRKNLAALYRNHTNLMFRRGDWFEEEDP